MLVNPEDLNVNFFLTIFYLCLFENEVDEETESQSYWNDRQKKMFRARTINR